MNVLHRKKKLKDKILAMDRAGYFTHEIAKNLNITEAEVVNTIERSRIPIKKKRKL